MKYKRIHYDSHKKEYKVNKPINSSATGEEASVPSVSGEFAPTSAENPSGAAEGQITPPTVDTEVSSNAAESEISLDFAQDLAAIFKKHGKPIPDNINEVVNPKDLDARLNIALQHAYWKQNSVPVYDKDTSHFPSEILMDPSDPDSFFNFFWLDEDLELIVKESNKYISTKNWKKKNYPSLNELKRFIGVCMYISTYRLPNPRNYWKESHDHQIISIKK